MRVLPILFNTEMVKAILDCRKTVTRRICKDGDEYAVPDMDFFDTDKRTYAVHSYADMEHTDKLSIAERLCPICPGDILYVRETWGEIKNPDGSHKKYVYRASDTYPFGEKGYIVKFHWRPSIHMPKEAARIWLKVTDVRVERLQEITPEQVVREGVTGFDMEHLELLGQHYDIPFAVLWDSTIKETDLDQYGWEANPWIWVIEFERCGKPGE